MLLFSSAHRLNQYLSALTKISCIYNVAIFITNQVTADPGASAMFGPVSKPIGGHVLAHASTVRIFLKKGRGEQRIAKIYDSPDVKPRAIAATCSSCRLLSLADGASFVQVLVPVLTSMPVHLTSTCSDA